MCGIIGYVGHRPCEEILVSGLEHLEYRGYDSAGVAMLIPDGVEKVRAVGNLAKLREALETERGLLGFEEQASRTRAGPPMAA
jgi:glucosamine--fructose-6-phosphate aminotransferase (isomerizing)